MDTLSHVQIVAWLITDVQHLGSNSMVQQQRLGPQITTTHVRISAWAYLKVVSSLPLEVARPIQPTVCTTVAVNLQSTSLCNFLSRFYFGYATLMPVIVKQGDNNKLVSQFCGLGELFGCLKKKYLFFKTHDYFATLIGDSLWGKPNVLGH